MSEAKTKILYVEDNVYMLSRRLLRKAFDAIVMTAVDLSDDDRRRLEGGAQLVLKKGAYDWTELFEELRFAVAQYTEGRERRA